MTIDPNAGTEPVLERCEVSAAHSGAAELVLRLAGAWTLQNRIPPLDELRASIEPTGAPTWKTPEGYRCNNNCPLSAPNSIPNSQTGGGHYASSRGFPLLAISGIKINNDLEITVASL